MSVIPRAPMASSPPSSDEATHQTTPSTIPSYFSPEVSNGSGSETRVKHGSLLGLAVEILDRAASMKPTTKFDTLTDLDNHLTTSSGDDVFLNAPLPTPASLKSPLSPTADVFTPGCALTPLTNTPRPYPAATTEAAPGVIGQAAVDTAMSLLAAKLNNADLAPAHRITIADLVYSEGVFSTDERVSRSFVITLASPSTVGAFQAIIKTAKLQTLEVMDLGHLETNGVIAATFADIREAKQAFALCMHSNWQVVPLNPRDAALHQRAITARDVSLFEGQLILSVFYDERNPPDAHATLDELHRQLAKFGTVKALTSLPVTQRNVREFRSEFFDLNATTHLLSAGTIGAEIFVFNAVRFTPDVPRSDKPVRRDPAVRAPVHLSATGRSTVPAGTPGYEALLHTLQDDFVGRRNAGHAFTRIDVRRIRFGLDVRTTVMLRNIPNRVTSPMLKEIIDETSRGAYDFMYLRIDFANNCNVGYAFINFVDPLAITPFAEAHQGQRWNAFNSDKVAEISYATIQGRENLIEKFRNSSVMLEHPDFRPKLYFTGPGSDAGDEEPFPGPNNLQKMRRSVENAEHVGLYRPLGARFSPKKSPMMSSLRSPRKGTYTAPARAEVSPANTLTPPPTPALAKAQPAKVDVQAAEDPFNGRTDGFPQTHFRLFAPRQGQAYREEQRRRRSQFDRGTPGAELEMADFRGAARSLGAIPSPSPTEYRYSAFNNKA